MAVAASQQTFAFLFTMLILVFVEAAVNQYGSSDCCGFMTGISSQNSQLNTFFLHAEKTAKAVLPYL